MSAARAAARSICSISRRSRLSCLGFAEEQAAVAADGLEEVVEVVGDAGGQRADDFHFLGLEELLLEFVVMGLVGDVADEAADLGAVDPGGDLHQPVAAVGALVAVVGGPARLEDFAEDAFEFGAPGGSGT
jgi:hypothetical protein